MEREQRGGWVYIMTDRYRGTMYVGVISHLASRIHQHRSGNGSDFCARYGLVRLVWAERGDDIVSCIEHEKCLKRSQRRWKFDLIEHGNPDWQDMFDMLAEEAGPRVKPGVTGFLTSVLASYSHTCKAPP